MLEPEPQSVYSIRMGQAAIVRYSKYLSNAVYTGGNTTSEKLYTCSAIVVPHNTHKAVGMYHFPAGEFGAVHRDSEVAREIIGQLLDRLTPTEIWVYGGGAVLSEVNGQIKTQMQQKLVLDIKAITAFVHEYKDEQYSFVEVKPEEITFDKGEPYIAIAGYAKAYFKENGAAIDVVTQTRGQVYPPYNNMIKIEEVGPRLFDKNCLIIANTGVALGQTLGDGENVEFLNE